MAMMGSPAHKGVLHGGVERADAESDMRSGMDGLRQILYVSLSSLPGDKADLAGILHQSRHNNALDGITGLLWSDGRRFLQVLEGPAAGIALTFERIRTDPRHHSLQVLGDHAIDTREFGTWTMAYRGEIDAHDAYDARAQRLLLNASSDVRAQFLGLIASGKPSPLAGQGA